MQKKGRSTKKYLEEISLEPHYHLASSVSMANPRISFFSKKVIRTNTVVLFIQIQSNSLPADQLYHPYIFTFKWFVRPYVAFPDVCWLLVYSSTNIGTYNLTSWSWNPIFSFLSFYFFIMFLAKVKSIISKSC